MPEKVAWDRVLDETLFEAYLGTYFSDVHRLFDFDVHVHITPPDNSCCGLEVSFLA